MSFCKPVVVFDVDDTLYQCNGPAVEQCGGSDIDINQITKFGLTGNPVLDNRLRLFKDPKFVWDQPMYPGAKEFVYEMTQLANVYFCTAVPPECMEVRAKAIIRDLGEFGIDESRIIIAKDKSLIRCDYFLDDCSDNIEKSIARFPVLFRRPWNHDISGKMSVTKYEDFVTFFKHMERRSDCKIEKNSILCLVGPSGSNKTEKIKWLEETNGFVPIRTYSTTPSSGYIQISEEDFIKKSESGFFAETTVYAGNRFGVSLETVGTILKNSNTSYVCAVDLCGAMALKNLFQDRVVIVFVEEDKDTIYGNILTKDIALEEKVRRLRSVDAEIENKKFCDITFAELTTLLRS